MASLKKELEFYDKLVATNPNFKRKGKTMFFTSANGYMFSQLNKAGEIGIRLSKESGTKFMEEHNTTGFKSYGANMRGYVLIPKTLYRNMELLAALLEESYQYVMSLPTK